MTASTDSGATFASWLADADEPPHPLTADEPPHPLTAEVRHAIGEMLGRAEMNLKRAREAVTSGHLKRAQALIRATNALGAAASQTMLAEAPGHA